MFAATIEGLVVRDRITYMDAIIEFGDRHGVEMAVLTSLVKKSPVIKSKLEAESIRLRKLVTPKAAEIAFQESA
jgi:hypothetical protein